MVRSSRVPSSAQRRPGREPRRPGQRAHRRRGPSGRARATGPAEPGAQVHRGLPVTREPSLRAATTTERICADALVDAERRVEARTRFVWLRQFEPEQQFRRRQTGCWTTSRRAGWWTHGLPPEVGNRDHRRRSAPRRDRRYRPARLSAPAGRDDARREVLGLQVVAARAGPELVNNPVGRAATGLGRRTRRRRGPTSGLDQPPPRPARARSAPALAARPGRPRAASVPRRRAEATGPLASSPSSRARPAPLIATAQDDAPVRIRPFDAVTFSLGDLWPPKVAPAE